MDHRFSGPGPATLQHNPIPLSTAHHRKLTTENHGVPSSILGLATRKGLHSEFRSGGSRLPNSSVADETLSYADTNRRVQCRCILGAAARLQA